MHRGRGHHHSASASATSTSRDPGQRASSSAPAPAHPLLRDLTFVWRRPVWGKYTRSVAASTLRPLTLMPDSARPADSGVSCNFSDCLRSREMGLASTRFAAMRLSGEYATRHMLSNNMLEEYPASVPNMNKVLCSQWLSRKQVVFGTGCNRLMVYDVNNGHMDQIPSLASSANSNPTGTYVGIRAVEINPSRTLLATGAENANDIAIYRLPTLDPICVGETGDRNAILDMTWMDNEFLVSAAWDGNLGLWRVTDDMIEKATAAVIPAVIPSYQFTKPLLKKQCNATVRSICYNNRSQEIAVLLFDGSIQCWNAARFEQMTWAKKPSPTANAECLALDEEAQMYAVGLKARTVLLDARTLQTIKKIPSNICWVRSISLKGNILTIGTRLGMLRFWDIRAFKFLKSATNSKTEVKLETSRGWVEGGNPVSQPAVYTHSYDESGTRLFAAGGPRNNIRGNYIALFQ